MTNAKEQIPPPQGLLRVAFDRGHAFGDAIKRLFPNGEEVNWNASFQTGLSQTQEYVRRRIPIFEAGFTANGCHARADVLNPAENMEWDIVEVKNSETVMPVFCLDVAFQRHCFRAAGLSIRRCFILTPDRKYISDDRGTKVIWNDVTSEVDAHSTRIEERTRELSAIAEQAESPIVETGDHCMCPYVCQMYKVCHGTRHARTRLQRMAEILRWALRQVVTRDR